MNILEWGSGLNFVEIKEMLDSYHNIKRIDSQLTAEEFLQERFEAFQEVEEIDLFASESVHRLQ